MLQVSSVKVTDEFIFVYLFGGSNVFNIELKFKHDTWKHVDYHDCNKWIIDYAEMREECEAVDLECTTFISYEQFIELVCYADSIESEC